MENNVNTDRKRFRYSGVDRTIILSFNIELRLRFVVWFILKPGPGFDLVVVICTFFVINSYQWLSSKQNVFIFTLEHSLLYIYSILIYSSFERHTLYIHNVYLYPYFILSIGNYIQQGGCNVYHHKRTVWFHWWWVHSMIIALYLNLLFWASISFSPRDIACNICA